MSDGWVMRVGSPKERKAAIAAASAALRAGEPVGVPTDTVYGLAADAADADAIGRLFALKQRPVDRSIAVLVADLAGAETLCEAPFSGAAAFAGARSGSVEWAIAWAPGREPSLSSYANGIATPDGGTHVAGLRDALRKGIRA